MRRRDCRWKWGSVPLGYINIDPRIKVRLRPCSHCRSYAGTVPICRISGVCERAMSVIKLDLISENLIRSREGSVFRHNYLCRNKCNVNADYTYVGERWRCRLDIINVLLVNGSQSIYLLSLPFVNICGGNPFDCLTDHRSG